MAYDDAVKDADTVVHTATTLRLAADDPQEFIGPASSGTISLFTSALKHGTKVKRAIMSSISTTHDMHAECHRFDNGKDWNNCVVGACKTKGREASGTDKYEASKVLSERAV